MRVCAVVLLLFCSTITFSWTVEAGIYKYRDENGRLIFVDEEYKIPAQYRDQAASIREAPSRSVAPPQDETPEDEAVESSFSKFLKSRAEEKELAKYRTPVVIDKNRILVPAQVSIGSRTVSLELLLDTGATRTVFHRRALAELDLPSGKHYKARVAGGGIVKSEKIQFRKFKVGPFQITKAKAMVISLEGREVPFDGMLGMDFLKHHPYQIDYENKLIVWEKQ